MGRASRALLLAVSLALVAGCQTDRDGLSINLTAAARAYRQLVEARSAGIETEHLITGLGAQQLTDLGVMYERDGRLDDAAWAYHRAIRRDLRFAPAYVNLGNVLRKRGEHEEALHRYRQAMAADPGSFAAANNFADLCAEQRLHLDEAVSLLRVRLPDAGPHRAYGLDTLGWLHHLRGDDQAALGALRESARAAGKRDLSLRVAVHRHLAAVLSTVGRAAEAADHAAEAERLRQSVVGIATPGVSHSATKGGDTTHDESS